MSEVLHSGDNEDKWISAIGQGSQMLNASGDGYMLRMANRLRGRTDEPIKPDYLERAKKAFGAPLEQVDFRTQPEPSRQLICDWVSKRTENKILEFLPKGSVPGERGASAQGHLLGTRTW